MPDKLAILARLRHLEAELAKRDLAHALRAERAAEAALNDARRAPLTEAAAIPADAAHPLVVGFARWLPAASAAIAHRTEDTRRAAAARQSAGHEAATRKAALEAVETLQAERAQASRKHALRREQLGLDELGRGQARRRR